MSEAENKQVAIVPPVTGELSKTSEVSMSLNIGFDANSLSDLVIDKYKDWLGGRGDELDASIVQVQKEISKLDKKVKEEIASIADNDKLAVAKRQLEEAAKLIGDATGEEQCIVVNHQMIDIDVDSDYVDVDGKAITGQAILSSFYCHKVPVKTSKAHLFRVEIVSDMPDHIQEMLKTRSSLSDKVIDLTTIKNKQRSLYSALPSIHSRVQSDFLAAFLKGQFESNAAILDIAENCSADLIQRADELLTNLFTEKAE